MTSCAASPPINALTGARSPAATNASFLISGSSSSSTFAEPVREAFTSLAKATISSASAWKRPTQERQHFRNSAEYTAVADVDCSRGGVRSCRATAHPAPGLGQAAVFLLVSVDGLVADVELSWTFKLGKVRYHQLWLGQGGGEGFLRRDEDTVGFPSKRHHRVTVPPSCHRDIVA